MKTKLISTLLTIILTISLFQVTLLAAPEATVDGTNLWGTGGQITLNLSGCDGYDSIKVVVSFDGTITKASGWGFDTYEIKGNQVTAICYKDGPNSWGYNNGVGIQVEGSNITTASLVSISDGQGSVTSAQTTAAETTAAETTAAQETTATQTSVVETSVIESTPLSEAETTTGNPNSVYGDDWLTTDGDKILDMNGNEVWLTGVSWFGYNTGTNIFDGCWSVSMREALESIADHGFNLLRIPISAELLLNWRDGVYPSANFNTSTNPELVGMNSLQIFEYALQICEENGLKVMLDIHSSKTDAMGHNAPLWYTDDFSANSYFEAVEWMANRWGQNDTIVAYDLKNEPHGAGNDAVRAVWNDTNNPSNWKAAAERAGNIILDVNPHALIVIEGIQIYPKDISSNNFISMNEDDYYNSWWGGNLRAVKDYPIDFGSKERNKQVVYSPHDYGPAVYQQPWFYEGFTYQTLMDDYWYDAWLYIDDTKTAPILIGEWGGFMSGDNLTWMTYLRQLIAEYHLNHTFWCFNANSGDTGGLVLDDFKTWDETKYEFVKAVLWQNSEGQFIGLDHRIALGSNGISLSEYTGDEVIPLDLESSSLENDSSSDSSPDVSPDVSGDPSGDSSGDSSTATLPDASSDATSDVDDAASQSSDENLSRSITSRLVIISVLVLLIAAGAAGAVIFRYRSRASRGRDDSSDSGTRPAN